MVGRRLDWKEELGRWLKPFLGWLGHKARRRMCPLYVGGLIGPGDRKSIQPMTERLSLGEYDQLHHFIAAGVWDAAPVETELLVQADRPVVASDAVLVIDDTAIPKKGTPTKPEMALAEIDRVIAAGVRLGCVLADAGYGLNAPFRQGLIVRKTGTGWVSSVGCNVMTLNRGGVRIAH